MKSFKKPTDEEVAAVIPKLSSPQHEEYFFDRLENPLWIKPLQKHGFFEYPPEPIEVDGGGTRFPHWPASRYLSRMASHAPAEVGAICKQLMTRNWSVARDIIEAAKQMPAPHAAELIEIISDLIDNDVLWHDLKDVAELVAYLAHNGAPDAACTLATSAFRLSRIGSGKALRRRDEHWYIEDLKDDVIPALVPIRSREMLQLLFQSLCTAIASERPRLSAEDDYSYIWRPAIEDHEQNSETGFASQLVSSLRDAAELAIRDHHLPLAEVLQMLEEQKHLVFSRLRLHLINTFAERDRALVRRTVMNRPMLNDARCKHEYAKLVGDRFELLEPGERNTLRGVREQWLKWVDAGRKGLNRIISPRMTASNVGSIEGIGGNTSGYTGSAIT